MGRKNASTKERGRVTNGKPRTYATTQEPEDMAYGQLFNDQRTLRIRKRMDEYQRAYYEALRTKGATIVDDPAGTGKTTIAWLAAIEGLRSGKYDRILYVRFPDDLAQSLGFLPGELQGPTDGGKEEIYFKPAYDALKELGLQPEAVNVLRLREQLVFMTHITMRGSNIPKSFVIIDEAQNAKKLGDLRLVLTRVHDTTDYAVIGHSKQQDGEVQTYYGHTAFQVYQRHLCKKPWAVKCRLMHDYRGEKSRHADSVEETLAELEREATGHVQSL